MHPDMHPGGTMKKPPLGEAETELTIGMFLEILNLSQSNAGKKTNHCSA